MGLVNNAIFTGQRAGINGSVVISPMPLFHTAGAVLSSLGCVTTGSTYVLPLLFEPELIMVAVEREKCDVFFGVPTMQIALLEHPKREQYDLGSLKVTISGGAPVPPELLRRVEATFNIALLTVYGQTEASPLITQADPGDSLDERIGTAGRPFPQVEVRIADPFNGQVQALTTEGEIQARGYQCMLGYFDMPDATAQAFTTDGWLRTGDLGSMDSRGFVRITGRLKDMIIRGGENVYPAEIEGRLLEHPSVMNVAVFGAPDAKWGEVICAALRFRDSATQVSVDMLKQYCGQTMAPHKVPSRWFRCEDFPMTASGKVQKFRLQELLQQGSLQGLQAQDVPRL
jgi:fatty-acyl-CoA synthase/long-chain acyl-CoA synthetase